MAGAGTASAWPFNGQALEMTMLEFLAHVRKNYLVGDRIVLNVIRGDKGLELPLTLR